jgi:hypothetical protein
MGWHIETKKTKAGEETDYHEKIKDVPAVP